MRKKRVNNRITKKYYWMVLIGKVGHIPDHMMFFQNKGDAVKDVRDYTKNDKTWFKAAKRFIGYQSDILYSMDGRTAELICYTREQAIAENYIDENGKVLPL